MIGVEDLWDLPLSSTVGKPNLDDIAKEVNRDLRSTQEESFVSKETKGNEILQLKLEVLKSIIQVKLAENETAAKSRENAEKKQAILALIAQKKGEQLAGTSLEDLMKMAEAL
jgi:CHASE3 domain sensor protein